MIKKLVVLTGAGGLVGKVVRVRTNPAGRGLWEIESGSEIRADERVDPSNGSGSAGRSDVAVGINGEAKPRNLCRKIPTNHDSVDAGRLVGISDPDRFVGALHSAG